MSGKPLSVRAMHMARQSRLRGMFAMLPKEVPRPIRVRDALRLFGCEVGTEVRQICELTRKRLERG
jgi:hypothetical protein